jgi:predicted NBD/HSP70 family sugar kinase
LAKTNARNRRQLLETLRTRGPISRSELARVARLSRSAVSALVGELIEEGLLRETDPSRDESSRSVGRPSALVELSERRGYFIGVDFGRLFLRIGLSDGGYRLIRESESEFSVDRPADEALDEAATRVGAMIRDAGIDRSEILGVGIGVPGPVDKHTGMLHAGSILAAWVGADVAGGLSKRLQLPVYMDNDANLGALAESTFGAAVGSEVMLYILLSVGVGLGVAIDGKIFRGAGGIAGELGHVVTDDMGALCRCGNRGCLEAKVSVNTLRDTLRPGHGPITVNEFLDLAIAGDTGAQRIIADAATLVGRLVGDLCNYFNPDLILVGGELMAVGDIALNPLRASMGRYAIARARENVRVAPAALGNRAELYGALLLAGQNSLHSDPPLTSRRRADVAEDRMAGVR